MYRCYTIRTWFHEPVEKEGTTKYRDGSTRSVWYANDTKVVIWRFA
jgi:hypothetical protein